MKKQFLYLMVSINVLTLGCGAPSTEIVNGRDGRSVPSDNDAPQASFQADAPVAATSVIECGCKWHMFVGKPQRHTGFFVYWSDHNKPCSQMNEAKIDAFCREECKSGLGKKHNGHDVRDSDSPRFGSSVMIDGRPMRYWGGRCQDSCEGITGSTLNCPRKTP